MTIDQPAASDITVSQTLTILDEEFKDFADGVAENRYVLWIGSGVSLGRVSGLNEIAPRVIEFLRRNIEPRNPNCRFRIALCEALDLAQLSDAERQCVDFARSFEEWQCAQAITNRLITNYSQLLAIQVEGETVDFLLWNGVDVVSTYAAPNIKPDVEHLCISILILEGVVSDIASANWDGLVEKAADMLTDGHSPIVVVVRSEDIRQLQQDARLFKFHGCAVKARMNEAEFRQYLIARQAQINRWIESPDNEVLVNRLVDLIVSKPTLMVGLSAQDANIQALFARAERHMPWHWSDTPPSYVFSEDAIGVDQRVLLQNVYHACYTPAIQQQIMDGALIRAYAKPLLFSLVLYVLWAKLRELILVAPGALDASSRDNLIKGVVAVRDQLAATAEPCSSTFILEFIDLSSRAMTMFRDGHTPNAPRRYNPISRFPIQRMNIGENLPASGLREVAVATGILGRGVLDGLWTLETIDSDLDGVVRINSILGSAHVYFAGNSHVALRLLDQGYLVNNNDAIVIQSLELVERVQRSPRRAPGRTGQIGHREVSIFQLLNEVNTSAELIQRFREEVAL